MTRLITSPAGRAAAAKRGLLVPAEPAAEQQIEQQTELSTSVTPEPAAIDHRAMSEAAVEAERADFRERLVTLDLQIHFPAVFSNPPKPLAIGIDRDIAAALVHVGSEYGTADLNAALARWTSQPACLRAITLGLPRVDLTGQPVSLPTPSERRDAAKKLAAIGGGQ